MPTRNGRGRLSYPFERFLVSIDRLCIVLHYLEFYQEHLTRIMQGFHAGSAEA